MSEYSAVETIVHGAGTLVSLGIAAWARWSIHQVAKEAATEESSRMLRLLEAHDDDPRTHRPLVEAWESSRDKALERTIGLSLAGLRTAITETLTDHNRDPWAHPDGSESRLGPIRASIDRMHETLAALDKRLAGLDGFVSEMQKLRRDHDEVIRRHASGHPLPSHGQAGDRS